MLHNTYQVHHLSVFISIIVFRDYVRKGRQRERERERYKQTGWQTDRQSSNIYHTYITCWPVYCYHTHHNFICTVEHLLIWDHVQTLSILQWQLPEHLLLWWLSSAEAPAWITLNNEINICLIIHNKNNIHVHVHKHTCTHVYTHTHTHTDARTHVPHTPLPPSIPPPPTITVTQHFHYCAACTAGYNELTSQW